MTLGTRDAVPADLLDAVVAYFRPLRVVLFGSAARGDTGPDSDIDLFVILDDDARPGQPVVQQRHEALAAGQDLGVVRVLGEHVEGLPDRRRRNVLEGVHRSIQFQRPGFRGLV